MKLASTDAEGLQCPSCGKQAMESSDKWRLGNKGFPTRVCKHCGAVLALERWTELLIGWPATVGLVILMGDILVMAADKGHWPGPSSLIEWMIIVVSIGMIVCGGVRVLSAKPRIPLEVRQSGRGAPAVRKLQKH